jgi:hypothetical protein
MALPSIFDPAVTTQLKERLNNITPDSKPVWGKMNAGQMLAHCNVTYEYVFEPGKYKPTPALLKLILKWMVKKAVVGEKPYKQGSPTGPDFKIVTNRNFEAEKARLITFIDKSRELGKVYFEGKESHSFGKLSAIEWNNMFYKHLDHHFRQFGV